MAAQKPTSSSCGGCRHSISIVVNCSIHSQARHWVAAERVLVLGSEGHAQAGQFRIHHQLARQARKFITMSCTIEQAILLIGHERKPGRGSLRASRFQYGSISAVWAHYKEIT